MNYGCMWAVAHKISGDNYDDGQERESIVALFRYPYQAKEFIDKCLPAENREKFYIKSLGKKHIAG